MARTMNKLMIIALACLISGTAFATDYPDPTDVTVGKPDDISQELFAGIRKACADHWFDDYRMRAYCERLQFDAIRTLRGGKPQ
jgi:hypothetical protein